MNELKWLDSKGFSDVEVTCEKCKRKFETLVHIIRKDDALEHDTFFCEKCSKEYLN